MKPLLLLLLSITSLSAAETREWRNPDGTKSVRGYVFKRDSQNLIITLSKNARQQTIPLNQLHQDDLNWLNQNHPPTPSSPAKSSTTTDQDEGVLENLRFGDSRSEVTRKLKHSKMFEATMAETFFGRMGLNGIFKSKEKIGGLHGFLYFDWDENDGLQSITVQTEPQDPAMWKSQLEPCMTEFVNLLSALYGKVTAASQRTDPATLQDGMIMADFLWKLEPKGSILLGPSKIDGKLHVAVRFTQQEFAPSPAP